MQAAVILQVAQSELHERIQVVALVEQVAQTVLLHI